MTIILNINEKEYKNLKEKIRLNINNPNSLEQLSRHIFLKIKDTQDLDLIIEKIKPNGVTVPYFWSNDNIVLFGKDSLIGNSFINYISKVIELKKSRQSKKDFPSPTINQVVNKLF